MSVEVVLILVILLTAIVVHEYAHGWTAYRFGDSTAKMAGRLTLNPIRHIDPVGTVILPAIFFVLRLMGYHVIPLGWAKPVPVNFMKLRNPKRDMIWVALAGPAVNIAMALAASFLIKFLNLPVAGYEFLGTIIFVNLLLAVFNMMPIPPLDGSRVLMGLLPIKLARPYSRLEPFGLVIIVGLLYLGVFEKIIIPVVKLLGAYLGVQI